MAVAHTRRSRGALTVDNHDAGERRQHPQCAGRGRRRHGCRVPRRSTLRDEMAVSGQRLLAASGQIPMAAHTSDRALAPTRTSAGHGYVVPISPSSALLLTRSTNRHLGYFKKGRWYFRIPHVLAPAADERTVVNALADFALSSLYGSDACLCRDAFDIDRRM